MKKSLLALSALVLFGCGQADESVVNGGLNARTDQPSRVLYNLENARITDVQNHISPFSSGNGAQGGLPQTEITVEYLVPCYETLEAFSHSIAKQDGKLVLYTNALASSVKGGPVCLAFARHEEKIVVEGYFTQADVSLVQLTNSAPIDLSSDISKVSPAMSVKVVKTQSLCRRGALCTLNGTRVTLAVEVASCGNKVGPLAYAVSQTETGVDLHVAGTDLQSHLALLAYCTEGPYLHKTEITLPVISVNKHKINLIQTK